MRLERNSNSFEPQDKKTKAPRIIEVLLFGADYGLAKRKQLNVVFASGVRQSKERDELKTCESDDSRLCDSKGTRTRSSPKTKTKAPRINEVLLSGADYGLAKRKQPNVVFASGVRQSKKRDEL